MSSVRTSAPTREGILRYIAEFVQRHEWPPSVQEIRRAFHLSSNSNVTWHLNRLAAAGLLHREPGARRIRLTSAGKAFLGGEQP